MTGEKYNLNNPYNISKLEVDGFYEYHRIILTELSNPEKEEVGVYVIQVLDIDLVNGIVLVKIILAREKENLFAYKKSKKIDLGKHIGTQTRIYFNKSFDSYLIEL